MSDTVDAMRLAVVVWLACTGCSQIFGLDEPARPSDAGGITEDSSSDDADMDAVADSGIDAPTTAPRVRRIDITDANVTAGPHVDFPVLVSLSTTYLRSMANGGEVARNDGFDIYFTTDQAATEPLAFEVERYEPTTGALIAWVELPALSASSVFYLHYGDSTITASRQNRAAVWGGYAFVSHLADATDATANNATISSTNVTFASGHIGNAADFNGTTSQLDAGSATAIDDVFGGGGLAQAWIRPTAFGENERGRIMDKGASQGWHFFVDSFNRDDSLSFVYDTTGTDAAWIGPNNAINMNQWQHVVVVYDTSSTANDASFFVNGTLVAETQLSAISGAFIGDAASNLLIGNSSSEERGFAGSIDEVRLSTTVRSAGWIATEYANHSAPAAFYTVSAPL